MKKKVLELLQTKFSGVNDTILSRIADKLAKTATTDEEAATAVEGVTTQQLLESYGDARANEAQQTAVTNYEKKHRLKDGKALDNPEPKADGKAQPKPETPKPEGSDKPRPDEDVPEWAKTLIAGNDALRSEIETLKGERTANSRKSRLASVLKDAPEAIRTRYDKDFARMTFRDDEDFEGWIGEITPDIESIATAAAARGAATTPPKSGDKGVKTAAVNPLVKERYAERQAAKTAPAIQGLDQPTK